jgi:hypothetical protein
MTWTTAPINDPKYECGWTMQLVRSREDGDRLVAHPQCKIQCQPQARHIGNGEWQALLRYEMSYVIYGPDQNGEAM